MFIWSAFAHLIALTSPGPDTAIVIRQVSIHGRLEGIKTSLGIGFGILIHCILAISGISLIILANDLYKFVISLVGGIYILYLGLTMMLLATWTFTDIQWMNNIVKSSLNRLDSPTNRYKVKTETVDSFPKFQIQM